MVGVVMDYAAYKEESFLRPYPKGWRPKIGERVLYRVGPIHEPKMAVIVRRRENKKQRRRPTSEPRPLPTYLVVVFQESVGNRPPATRLSLVPIVKLRPVDQNISHADLLTIALDSVINKF